MSGLPFSCFDTRSYIAPQRFDAFRESINVIFDVKRREPQEESFFGNIKTYLIDEMLLVNVSASEQEFLRSPSMIAKDTIDHFLIQIFHKGATHPLNFTHDMPGESGKILVLDASKPWKAFNSDFNNLTLVLPRRLLKDKLIGEHRQHGRVIDVGVNPFAEILYKYMLSLENSVEKILSEDAHSLISPSSDLVAAALNFSMRSSGADEEAARFYCETAQKLRIKEFLEECVSDPNFKAEHVQARFKISRSHLYRIFADTGGVLNYLRKRRMEIAYKSLMRAKNQNISIAEIAYAVGFQNESSFSRAFKSFFGACPTEARDEFEALGLSGREFQKNPGRVWESWFCNL